MNTQSWKRVNLGGAGRSRWRLCMLGHSVAKFILEGLNIIEFKRKQVVLA